MKRVCILIIKIKQGCSFNRVAADCEGLYEYFELRQLALHILVAFEIRRDRRNVLGISYLAVMCLFEVLLELVQFRAQLPPLLFQF